MKKIFLILLILISFLTISAVAAAENTTFSEISEDAQQVLSENDEKQDLDITIHYPDKVVKMDYEYLPTLYLNNVPNDYQLKYYDIYVDGAFDKTMDVDEINENNEHAIDINKYSFGNHTISVNLGGNAKYNPANLTKTFSIVESEIWIADEIISGESSMASVSAVKGATGTFTVNVDGKFFKKVNLVSNEYMSHAEVDLSILDIGTHEIEAIYSGDQVHKKNQLKKTAFSTFKIDFFAFMFDYGYEYNCIDIYLPMDCVNAPIVTINGRKYNVTQYDECYRANMRYAPLGEFNVSITYPGDNKYSATTVNKTYSTYPMIHIYENGVGYNAEALLRLPEDANGNLTIYVNNESYKSVKLTGGEALIPLDLPLGQYNIVATYDGDDYIVENVTNEYYQMNPKFIYQSELTYGEKQTIYIKMNPNSTGKLTHLDTNTLLNISNGVANVTVGTERTYFEDVGRREFLDYNFRYEDESGYSCTYSISVIVKPIPAKFTNANDLTMYYGSVGKFSVKVWGNYGTLVGAKDSDTVIKFKIGKSEYPQFIGKNGIGSIKIGSETVYMKYNPKTHGYDEAKIKLLPGTYKITVIYGGSDDVKITKKLIIKQPLSLKTVKVKRSAKKLVLQATLKKGKVPMKNKAIIFKFNGKTYKTKTNSKGIAKITVKSKILKKLKAGKKITYSATFLKSTIKKTVKVYK